MTARDWFIVGVRLFGVWMLLQSALWVVEAAATHFQVHDTPAYSVRASFFHAGAEGGIGLFLLTIAAPLLWRERIEPEGFEVAPPNSVDTSSDRPAQT